MRLFRLYKPPLATIPIWLLLFTPVFSGTIELEWNALSVATGYQVHYGPSPGNYTAFVDAGNTTRWTLQGLDDCKNYYVAVKAYNLGGVSAQFSNEVSGWARPEIGSITPGTSQQGEQVTVDFNGANFQSGAELLIDTGSIPTDIDDQPLVRIDDITVLSCSRIQALLTVEPLSRGERAMEVGTLPLDLEVVNPDSVFGARTRPLEILFNPERADINRSNSETRDRVDGEDLVWLAYAYGTTEGESNHNSDADLDGNGLVDGVDLAYLAARFGACWDGSDWDEGACP